MSPGAATFRVEAASGSARAGTLTVRGKCLPTPAFLPVGTYGAVKGVPPDVLRRLGARLLLANACHLHDRPGEDVVAALGGLHRFMGWDGLLLTDSGGFQVFSLHGRARLDEDGVTFQSPVDGRPLRLGPVEAVAIQRRLDSDIAMVFDHCPPLPAPASLLAQAVDRTTDWAARAQRSHQASDARGQALFAIVQGGLDDALRRRSAEALAALDFDGYALGGLGVGETPFERQAALPRYAPLLPESRVRYLMGVGRPDDLLAAIAAGFDMFDCVLPSRNARHGALLTRQGTLHLRNAAYRTADGPVEPGCDCPACGWPLGALRHLHLQGDPLAHMLCTSHNLRHLHRLVDGARAALLDGSWPVYLAAHGPAATASAASAGSAADRLRRRS